MVSKTAEVTVVNTIAENTVTETVASTKSGIKLIEIRCLG